ncbi:MAG TPA: hypothetical protein PKZ66_00665 [Chitinophagaceae bacterium]|nr:hypothetical protein [Chitinophagaceae bacterium]
MNSSKLIVLITCFVFLGCALFFINNNFWQDEIYTLIHFVFVPFKTALTNYHNANNHILFSLVLNIHKQIAGINNLQQALLNPVYFRIIPFIISTFSFIIFYTITAKIYGKQIALIASSVFASTFALLNFSVQLRGYSLSTFLAIIQTYYFLKIIKNQVVLKTDFIKLFIATSLCIFCLPVNVYYATAMILLAIIIYVFVAYKKYNFSTQISKHNIFYLILSLLFAIVLNILYYYWLFSFSVPTENNLPVNPFAIKNFTQAFAAIFHLTHFNFHFYLIVVVAFYLMFKKYKISSTLNWLNTAPIAIFILFFLIYFIHGSVIIQRIYLVLIPVFSLFVAICFNELCTKEWISKRLNLFLLLNCITLLLSFYVAKQKVVKNNIESIHTQDLINHYYLFNYNPYQASLVAQKIAKATKTNLFFQEGFGDSGIKYYLKESNINYSELQESTLLIENKFTLLTNNKKWIEELLVKHHWNLQKKLSNLNYYTVYLCSKN